MPGLKIGVMLSSFKTDPEEGLRKVVELGVPGVHLNAHAGPFSPGALEAAARRQLVKKVRELGLEITAISAWGGDRHITEPAEQEENLKQAAAFLDLAADLECRIWQAHVGVIPGDTSDPAWTCAVETAGQIAAPGEKVGACLAIETGPEPPSVLRRFIETVGSRAIRVNYDPANLLIWPAWQIREGNLATDLPTALREFAATEGAAVLGPYVVHTHAKDARVTEEGDFQEVPIGEGQVDWPRYISLLKQAGYDGYFAIEREVGEDRAGDIAKGVAFLRTL